METLSLMHRHLPGVTLLSVGGELDLATSEQLEEYCRHVCRPGDDVIFDLARLRFLDCSGLRVLIRTHHHVRQDGGTVRLSGLRPGPAMVVKVAHTDAVMPVHAGLDDAIRAAVGSTGHRRTSPRRHTRRQDWPVRECQGLTGARPETWLRAVTGSSSFADRCRRLRRR
jgi:anti-sigma B factor antagonist